MKQHVPNWRMLWDSLLTTNSMKSEEIIYIWNICHMTNKTLFYLCSCSQSFIKNNRYIFVLLLKYMILLQHIGS